MTDARLRRMRWTYVAALAVEILVFLVLWLKGGQ
jgi:hypothetical protein